MNDKQPWYWIDENRTLRELALHEMVASIHAGAIPTNTLTWTEGMSTFVEACNVTELRDACRLAPKSPANLPAPGDIVQATDDLLKAWQRTARLVGPPSSSRESAIAAATVPPPKPGVPNLAAASRKPAAVGTVTAPIDERTPSVTPDESQVPDSHPEAAPPAPKSSESSPPIPMPSIPANKPPLSLTPEGLNQNDDGKGANKLLFALAAGGLVALLAVGSIVYAVRSHSTPASASSSSSTTTSDTTTIENHSTKNKLASNTAPAAVDIQPPPIPAKPSGPWSPCNTTAMHKRLIVGGDSSVPIEVLPIPGKPQVSVTFAARNYTAVGFVLDMTSLTVRNSYSRRQAAPIRHVTTIFRNDSVSYHADLDNPEDPVRHVFTLGGISPVRLGIFKRALTAATGLGQAPKVLWKLPFDSDVRSLQARATGSAAIATVLRTNDSLWLAWIGNDGQRMTPPKLMNTEHQHLGTISLGWNGYQLLIAYAARKNDKAPWQIYTTMAFPGRGPGSSTLLLDHDANHPAVTGLPDGRWLVSWTVHEENSYHVTGQTFDPDLKPIGDRWKVSRKRSRTMFSGIGATGEGGVVAYASPVGKMLEVQAQSLTCK